MAPETGGNTPDGVLNLEDALAVRYEEGHEDGLEKGLEKGLEDGRKEGLEKGLEKGALLVLDLVQQGYNAEEIKQKLQKIDIAQ